MPRPTRDAIAIDGKGLRDIHGEQLPGVRLVAAYSDWAGLVLAQSGVRGSAHEVELSVAPRGGVRHGRATRPPRRPRQGAPAMGVHRIARLLGLAGPHQVCKVERETTRSGRVTRQAR
jgi:hypothetical protein